MKRARRGVAAIPLSFFTVLHNSTQYTHLKVLLFSAHHFHADFK